jgi:hypothetical protein
VCSGVLRAYVSLSFSLSCFKMPLATAFSAISSLSAASLSQSVVTNDPSSCLVCYHEHRRNTLLAMASWKSPVWFLLQSNLLPSSVISEWLTNNLLALDDGSASSCSYCLCSILFAPCCPRTACTAQIHPRKHVSSWSFS